MKPGNTSTQNAVVLKMEMIFTGKRIDAEKANEIGLVNRVCAQTALMAECREMAAAINIERNLQEQPLKCMVPYFTQLVHHRYKK